MKKKNKGMPLILIFLLIIVFIIVGIILFNHKDEAGYIKKGEVFYSEKIINKRYNRTNEVKTIEIKSVDEEIDSILITNKKVEEIKNNDEYYTRMLKEVLQDNDTPNREIYNINKSIELGYVNDDTKLYEYYFKITGFKNYNDFVKFCEDVFDLMEKDSNL